jgi:hypothetical protein
MTAEILLFLFLFAATALAAGLGAIILAAFGQTGWFVILALVVTGLLAWRLAAAHLAARSEWLNEDLRDDWRAGRPPA